MAKKFFSSLGKLLVLPILIIWQLPQLMIGTLVALILWADGDIIKIDINSFTTNDLKFKGGCIPWLSPPSIKFKRDSYFSRTFSGCSLVFTILPDFCSEYYYKHEFGHYKQSLILGPLYLFVIGIPSICLNIISRYNKKVWENYYNFYTERWANKLGGNI